MNKQISFPLVADDEMIVGQSPDMDLYEEYDLISNIKGAYHDRFAQPAPPAVVEEPVAAYQPPLQATYQAPMDRRLMPNASKTQGQLAREQAREDLKRKRSADYLKQERPAPARVFRQSAPVVAPVKTGLSALADRLSQDHYILADMPQVYSLDKEDRGEAKQQTSNSYDFLKRSQVYDYPERRVRRERQIAAELNLRHMEEEME